MRNVQRSNEVILASERQLIAVCLDQHNTILTTLFESDDPDVVIAGISTDRQPSSFLDEKEEEEEHGVTVKVGLPQKHLPWAPWDVEDSKKRVSKLMEEETKNLRREVLDITQRVTERRQNLVDEIGAICANERPFKNLSALSNRIAELSKAQERINELVERLQAPQPCRKKRQPKTKQQEQQQQRQEREERQQ